jgi:hypothetical protein
MKKLTPCEIAFADYMMKQSFEARQHSVTRETVIAKFPEAFDDWMVAVRWGQAHPKEGVLSRGAVKPTFKPLFLRRGQAPEALRPTKLEHTMEKLRVHKREECPGDVCCIHKRSKHALRAWPQHFRIDRGIMERICEHGIGHPDPDDLAIVSGKDNGVHGCCGCCRGVASKNV